ncbi:MAG: HNH endonuclease [Pseudomonadota bacterium]
MTPEEIALGLERYLTRERNDPRQFAINFRNSLIFVFNEGHPDQMVPLAWALSALNDGWESTTRSMNSGNARTRAEAAGLLRIECDHPDHAAFWEVAMERVAQLARPYLSEKQIGFSRHHSAPRRQEENSFYVIPSNACGASFPNETELLSEHEGAAKQITTNRYERKASLRAACIRHYRAMHDGVLLCEACGFDFERAFGPVGAGFIHIHHKHPLGNLQEERLVDPLKDLVPLCPNCHAMAHRFIGVKETPRDVCTLKKLRQK